MSRDAAGGIFFHAVEQCDDFLADPKVGSRFYPLNAFNEMCFQLSLLFVFRNSFQMRLSYLQKDLSLSKQLLISISKKNRLIMSHFNRPKTVSLRHQENMQDMHNDNTEMTESTTENQNYIEDTTLSALIQMKAQHKYYLMALEKISNDQTNHICQLLHGRYITDTTNTLEVTSAAELSNINEESEENNQEYNSLQVDDQIKTSQITDLESRLEANETQIKNLNDEKRMAEEKNQTEKASINEILKEKTQQCDSLLVALKKQVSEQCKVNKTKTKE